MPGSNATTFLPGAKQIGKLGTTRKPNKGEKPIMLDTALLASTSIKTN